jgi:hypothetical protein
LRINKRNATRFVGRPVVVNIGWGNIYFGSVGKLTAVRVIDNRCHVTIVVTRSKNDLGVIARYDFEPVEVTIGARMFNIHCRLITADSSP